MWGVIALYGYSIHVPGWKLHTIAEIGEAIGQLTQVPNKETQESGVIHKPNH